MTVWALSGSVIAFLGMVCGDRSPTLGNPESWKLIRGRGSKNVHQHHADLVAVSSTYPPVPLGHARLSWPH